MEPMKVVARYSNGRIVKGYTSDLLPNRDCFHLVSKDGPQSDSVVVYFKDLKAVFIVKDFAGRPDHKEKNEFEQGKAAMGKKIEVTFKDGEKLIGTTQGYNPGRPNFYLVPADTESNIDRCLVITAATKEVKFL